MKIETEEKEAKKGRRSGMREREEFEKKDGKEGEREGWREAERESRYSNQNYQLLALIIKQVTAARFEDYIRDSILTPLGMRDTYFWDEVGDQSHVAEFSDEVSGMVGKRNWDYIGSSGIFSTVVDL